MKIRSVNLFLSIVCIIFLLKFSLLYGFGKNKVQYSNLKWHYNKLPHFNSYFHGDQGDLPDITAQWIENAYTELYKDFGFKHKKPIPLIVFGSPTLFEQTNVISDIIPEGVGGFTEMLKNRIVVPFTGSYKEYRHVLHHELTHAFQFGIFNDQFAGSIFRGNVMQMPLWFAEGSAEFLSSGWDNEADMFLMDRTIFGSISLPGPNMIGYIVYKGGQSFLYFLSSSRGDSAFHNFLRVFRKTKKVEESLKQVYKKELDELGKEWLQELKRIYWPEIGKRENLEKKGRALTSHIESRSNFNLKPRISPDGSMIAYYSDEKDFTKIFICDKEGEVITKIGQFGYGGYFESFQPFRSGMCWSPESDHIAFVTKNKGINEVRIINVKTKKYVKTIIIDLASISSPDWSPDGNYIVFCGLKKHRSNLYLYDLKNEQLTQLTNDIRFESSPRFSRNGSNIIFSAIDTSGIADRTILNARPSSNLFLLKVKDKSIIQLTETPWNEKQPFFSPDGNSILFISDRNGINNIYIAPSESLDSAKALTNIIGGCSYPDWSKESNAIVFNIFQKQGWDIWLIDEPEKKLLDTIPSPTVWVKSLSDSTQHFFLPAQIPSDSTDITETLKTDSSSGKTSISAFTEDTIGIIEEDVEVFISEDSVSIDTSDTSIKESAALTDTIGDTEDTVSVSSAPVKDSIYTTPILPENMIKYPYKIKFTVDMVSVGMAYSTLYGYAGQGLIVLSDLLGNHQIALAGNIQGSIDENNIFMFYFNSKYRLDFGLGFFYDRYYSLVTLDYNNLLHDTNVGGIGLLRYPFSLFSRIDLNLYYQHIKRVPYRYIDGKYRPYESGSLKTMSVNITLPSLSYVYDNIFWGITGPVNGIRAKASLLTSVPLQSGDASFISFDFDIRNYWHIKRKFVWANRFTCGFSEPLGRDESERRYFLGGNENWIFYLINENKYEENIFNTIYSSYIVPFRGWNYFDITGVRYAVFNTEFRFPFVKSIDIVWPFPMAIHYINGAFFIDIGNAWDPVDEYEITPLPQDIYGGIGFGLRANLGIFILRYDLAWKTDWHTYLKDAHNYFSLGAEF